MKIYTIDELFEKDQKEDELFEKAQKEHKQQWTQQRKGKLITAHRRKSLPIGSPYSVGSEGDKVLSSIAEKIKEKNLVDLRPELEKMYGKSQIKFGFEGGAHFEIKDKGKTIIIINKNNVDAGEKDIVVGNLVVGYL